MDYGWLTWPIIVVYIWMLVKAYQFIRTRYGPRVDSTLASLGAWFMCGFLAPFMPFILIAQGIKRRRAGKGIVHPANRMPTPIGR
ncbi:MAG: hypothetical protein ACJ72L_20785 [Marmoricola sp.]